MIFALLLSLAQPIPPIVFHPERDKPKVICYDCQPSQPVKHKHSKHTPKLHITKEK